MKEVKILGSQSIEQRSDKKMRKVLVVLAVFVFQGIAFSGEINVRGGVDCYRGVGTDFRINETKIMTVPHTSAEAVGFSLATEYLGTINDFIKIGGGVEYVLPKAINTNGFAGSFAFCPIYFSIQANPAADGFFLKGNLGYVIHFGNDVVIDALMNAMRANLAANLPDMATFTPTKSGGLYFAAGIGYEFSSGLILDLTYSHYNVSIGGYISTNEDGAWGGCDIGFHRVALGVGYKFKLS
jgi:opacity protein-like surface antigen